ncbi:hypothetical protein BDP27DRAFT_1367597 [Rhodocollybia butyracea]|uniref:Peptidase metallopeptidase domain-containing protein n=1 Tax=Rhodocollybia butyracea TaxID=206335 RepID=A0A9P5U2W7_9AGAR|nr:hypothetical protein BDP27DRAFT_1367597 [Rhodocollybia butyracea]
MSIHFCAQAFLPVEKAWEAVEVALKENPNNAGYSFSDPLSPAGGITPAAALATPTPDAPLAIGLYVRKMWLPGRTLRCRLMGGTPYVQSKVRQYATVWEQYANIHFEFVDDGPADIRVGFLFGLGSWSYVGTDALLRPADEPTMNFGWLFDITLDEEFSRTVVHEFGHALGCIHEHQQPNASIQWNKPVVYDAYWRSQHWPPAQVDAQVFDHYNATDVTSSVFDSHSIMEYEIPAEFTLNGFSAPSNTRLSATDIAFITGMYPGVNVSPLDTGVFNSMGVRPWDAPTLDNRGTIRFSGAPLQAIPQILVGLNWFDFGYRTNVRIRSLVEQVTKEGCTINLQSWADTVNYSTGVSWLQLPANNQDFQGGTFDTTDPSRTTALGQVTRKIDFAHAYASPPTVVVFLASLDAEKGRNIRAKVYATDVQNDSFIVHVDSRSDTLLWNAGIAWFAYPTNKKGISSGTCSTSEVRSWEQASRLTNSKQTTFPNQTFDKTPRIFMAVNELDMGYRTNARIRLSSSNVTKTGMEWHIDAWGDTEMTNGLRIVRVVWAHEVNQEATSLRVYMVRVGMPVQDTYAQLPPVRRKKYGTETSSVRFPVARGWNPTDKSCHRSLVKHLGDWQRSRAQARSSSYEILIRGCGVSRGGYYCFYLLIPCSVISELVLDPILRPPEPNTMNFEPQ